MKPLFARHLWGRGSFGWSINLKSISITSRQMNPFHFFQLINSQGKWFGFRWFSWIQQHKYQWSKIPNLIVLLSIKHKKSRAHTSFIIQSNLLWRIFSMCVSFFGEKINGQNEWRRKSTHTHTQQNHIEFIVSVRNGSMNIYFLFVVVL